MKTKEITTTALFIALTYIFTVFVNIKLPIAVNGGLIHLGDTIVFVAAIIYGRKIGAISGAVGMALFDLLSGWTIWAPFTFIINFGKGFAVGNITKNKKTTLRCVFAFGAALIINVVGYYIAEVILYGNFIVALSSIPGDIIQIVASSIITLIVIKPLKRYLPKI